MKARCFVLVMVLCASFGASGEEFQVNVRTSSTQANPAVALTDAGDVVVVWSSYYTSSGRSNEIMARRFDPAAGPPERDEFQVNTLCEGNQTEPAVAATDAGGFVVVWHGPGLDEEDIFVRWFDPNGVPLADEQLVNPYTPGRQMYPRVAAGRAGACVVWECRGDPNSAEQSLIWAQPFDLDGSSRGEAFIVDESVYDCRYPDVALDAEGNFTVVWLQDRTSKTVWARCFDANGVPRTEPFAVSQIDCSSLTRPSVAMNRHGCFVVAWDGDPNRAGDDDIHARWYDPGGIPVGDQFVVNSTRPGAQQQPRVAINDANEFIIVWEHDTGDPNAATDIFARRFRGPGAPMEPASQLNRYTPGKQQAPVAVLAEDGSFIAAWECAEPDGSDYDIFACLAAPALTADFNDDRSVTFADFADFSSQWHRQTTAPGDLTQDGLVDARDLDAFVRQWLVPQR